MWFKEGLRLPNISFIIKTLELFHSWAVTRLASIFTKFADKQAKELSVIWERKITL
jgi:hypothetical protein